MCGIIDSMFEIQPSAYINKPKPAMITMWWFLHRQLLEKGEHEKAEKMKRIVEDTYEETYGSLG